MVTTTKLATGSAINLAAAWSSGVPTAADDAVWNSTSLGGTLTGGSTGINMKSLTINGATANIVFNNTCSITVANGTITLSASNNRTVTFGLNNPSLQTIYTSNTDWYLNNIVILRAAVLGASSAQQNRVYNTNPLAASIGNSYFLLDQPGTLVYADLLVDLWNYTGIACSRTTAISHYGSVVIKGVGCKIWGTVNNAILGSSSGTSNFVTTENDYTLGSSGFSFSLPATDLIYRPQSTHPTQYTVTIDGNVSVRSLTSGNQASAGFALNATNSRYQLSASIGNGLNGPALVTNGLFLSGSTGSLDSARYRPTALTVGSTGSFGYLGSDSTFNFPCTPEGTGAITIYGNYSGTGCVFPAGQLSNFNGTIRVAPVTAAGYEAPKIQITELPQGDLGWIAGLTTSTPASVGAITYAGVGESNVTGLVIDSWSGGGTAAAAAVTCSLLSSGSGPIYLSGSVRRIDSSGYAPSQALTLTLSGINSQNNTLSGEITESSVNDILNISKTGTGRWILSGNNSYTGSHSISAGTLSAQSATALGAATSTGVSITGTGVLELNGGITLNKSGTPFTLRAGTSSAPCLTTVGDNTLRSSGITLVASTNLRVDTGNKLSLRGGVISGLFNLSKWGLGELDLGSEAHSFTGTVSVEDGTLTVGNLQAGGVASSLGAGLASTNVSIWSDAANTTLLKYVGSSNSVTNRNMYFRSGGVGHRAGFDASGGGYVWYSSIQEGVSAGHTFVLQGTSTADNRITDTLSAFISIEKSGSGTWSLTNTLAPSGGSASYLTSLSILDGRLNLTGAVQLISSSSVTVSGGVLKVSTADGNTMACPVVVNSGANLELATNTLPSTSSSSGRVVGTGNVSVSGTVKTFSGSNQKGQMRYGGNLTLNSGAVIEIGSL